MVSQFKLHIPANNFVDITQNVNELVSRTGIKNGTCVVTVLSTSAALVFFEKDNKNAMQDVTAELDRIFSPRINYKSMGSPYGSSARSKSAFIGASKDMIVADGHVYIGAQRALYVVSFSEFESVELLVRCI